MSLPRTIMVSLLAGLLCCFFGMSGCGKKDAKSAAAGKAPSLSGASADSVKKDSADLFDEFYSEKEGGKSIAQKAKEARASGNTQAARTGAAAVAQADASSFDENGRYAVQISCVRSGTMADHLKEKLADKGYPAYVSEVQSPTPALEGTYYRVRIGGFRTVSQAKAFAEQSLTAAGFEYWVDNRSNDNVGISGSGFGSGGASGYESSGSTGSSYEASSGTSTYSTEPAAATTDHGSSPSTPAASSGSQSASWGTSSSTSSAPAASTTESGTTSSTPSAVAEPPSSTSSSSSSWTSTPSPESSSTPAAATDGTGGSSTSGGTSTESTTTKGDDWGNDNWGTSDTTKK